MTVNRGGAPWWQGANESACTFCGMRHVIEVAVHCTECDRPACPACYIEIHDFRGAYCPECAPRSQGEG